MKSIHLLLGLLSLTILTSSNTDQSHDKSQPSVTGFTSWLTYKPKVVIAANVEELYDAVDKQDNAGAHILLLRGVTYKLTSTDKNGQKRKNAGRIEFQPNMTIRGNFQFANPRPTGALTKLPSGERTPQQAIIDGSGLEKESFGPITNGPQRTGFIRMGKGTNTLQYVTIIGNTQTNINAKGEQVANALSAIDTDLPAEQNWRIVTIDHVLIIGGQTGINVRNPGAANNGRTIIANLTDNEMKQMKTVSGQGITVQNSQGVSSGTVYVTMMRNYSHHNNLGMRIMNQNTNSSMIHITSQDDRFEDNSGPGIIAYGGFLAAPPTGVVQASNNTVDFTGVNTSFKRNKGTRNLDWDKGDIYTVGGYNFEQPGQTLNNKVTMNLENPVFVNVTAITNIHLFGARRSPLMLFPIELRGIAGINNAVTVNVWSVNKFSFQAIRSEPAEGSPGSNFADVVKK